jgi:ribosomal protein S27E
MIECKECGGETIAIEGDSWDTVCRGCYLAYADDEGAKAEAEATGN